MDISDYKSIEEAESNALTCVFSSKVFLFHSWRDREQQENNLKHFSPIIPRKCLNLIGCEDLLRTVRVRKLKPRQLLSNFYMVILTISLKALTVPLNICATNFNSFILGFMIIEHDLE